MLLAVTGAILLGVGVLCATASFVGRRVDPRMLRNGAFATAAVVCIGAGLLTLLAAVTRAAGVLAIVLAVTAGVSILVLSYGLLVNGVVMLRRERRGLANRLSLIAGILVLVVPALLLALSTWLGAPGVILAVFLGLLTLYAAGAFASFTVAALVYARRRRPVDASAIVVLGSGLRRDGSVPPLLRSRLDRALVAYEAARAGGREVVLVSSGGKGSDERRSEAEAMAEYLGRRGVPASVLREERASRNTVENLTLSAGLLRGAGVPEPYLVVTSDYHVLRAASLARRLGIDAQVAGARTALYFLPSAFLREFAAIMVDRPWVTALALVLCALVTGFVVAELPVGWG